MRIEIWELGDAAYACAAVSKASQICLWECNALAHLLGVTCFHLHSHITASSADREYLKRGEACLHCMSFAPELSDI